MARHRLGTDAVRRAVGLQNAACPTARRRADDDYDAIVVGAGHNGLITAAYLLAPGCSVLLVEARDAVGGTAASERFAGATVNICNCDHVTFRTTPVIDELGLREHGLHLPERRAVAAICMAWSDETLWTAHHDLDATLDELARVLPERGRRLPRLRQSGDACGADDPCRRFRAAQPCRR